jgi:colanic acid/amylovoran biosynthesis glycosyltransferase
VRVAFIVNTFPEVSETFILNQLAGLVERGHEVDIYADRPEKAPERIHADVERFQLMRRTHYRADIPAAKFARVKSGAWRIIRGGWRYPGPVLNSLNVFRHGRRAANLSLLHKIFPVERTAPHHDIIHCHYGPNGQQAVQLRQAGTLRGPVITTFHGYDANLLPRIHGPDLYKILFQQGDFFTIGSEFMRQRIISLGAPAGRIVKLPMGVDVSRYRFAERKNPARSEMRLLTIARLVEVKGIEYLLSALALVKAKFPQLRCQIAGDGPLRSKLEAMAIKLGLENIVEFKGAVSGEEALRLYEAAHAFVLPSIPTEAGEVENQPVVLAEAQAAGLPVIATRIGGIPESMREGESGLLVPPRDSDALASAIIWLAERPERWAEMGRAGRAWVGKELNLQKLNDRLVEVYRELMPPKKCGRAL